MKVLYIIPARYASTRFPGKPLVEIDGKSMIQRVWEQVKLMEGADVIIATEDDRILKHGEGFGAQVMMTSADHQSGTDRCAEVVSKLDKKYDVVINVQGDEPYIKPEQLQELLSCFQDAPTQIATLVKEISFDDHIHDPNIVKCVIDKNKNALYFSRYPVPYKRNPSASIPGEKYYKHIGLYAYRPMILEQITKLPPSYLEVSESLEQLRWLENGYRIKVEISQYYSVSIDTPEDLGKIKKN
jgi:3-deoxy-manno-octulosonate cytidylyltransferase (CMP-KDO synthetase)